MMVSKAIEPQINAFFVAKVLPVWLGVHYELAAVRVHFEVAIDDRAHPARGGGYSAKRIEMRLDEAAAAVGGFTPDEARKHLIPSGRESSQGGHGLHVPHQGVERGAHATGHGELDELRQGRGACDPDVHGKGDPL